MGKLSNIIKYEKETELTKEKVITIKSNRSIAESNIMILPFVPVQNTKAKIYRRYWEVNGVTRGLVVKGSPDLGLPNIKDLDTLLALFRIMIKNSNMQYSYNPETNRVSGLNNVINFTRRELALEMGYKSYSGAIKNVIDKSLKRLNETTLYSDLAFRDIEKGGYVCEFNGEESTRIISNLKTYSYKRIKKEGGKLGNCEEVREKTSLKIEDFFFKNICNNFFKIYDYSQYLKIKLGIAKKLFLILNQWSHGSEKYITYKVMYDYLGVEIREDEKGNKNKKDIYYYNRQIKKSFDELANIKFIEGFEEDKKKNGINIIFDMKARKSTRFLNRYTNDLEVISKLRELEFSYDDITTYYRPDNQDYVRALLRLYDYKKDNKQLVNEIGFLREGLRRENYDITRFI